MRNRRAGGKLVGDVPSATAILDRFLHHAEVIQITGKSYRLRQQASASSEALAENETASSKQKTTKATASTTAPA